jgi:hypothetical protein
MKYVKMLGLAAVAAMALMAFVGVGSASATTTFCKTAASPCPAEWDYPNTTTIHATQVGSGKFAVPGITVTCTESTLHGFVTENSKVSVAEESLTFGGCNTTVKTVKGGTLSVAASGSGNGNVSASTVEVTINIGGVSCIFGAGESTNLGTYTESNTHITISEKTINKTGGSFLCPGSGTWTTTYKITQPTGTIYIS